MSSDIPVKENTQFPDPKIVQQLQEIHVLREEAFLAFYDYIIDQKVDLAERFIKDPFLSVDEMENHTDAKMQWGMFMKRTDDKVEDKKKIQSLFGAPSTLLAKAENDTKPGSILSQFANLQKLGSKPKEEQKLQAQMLENSSDDESTKEAQPKPAGLNLMGKKFQQLPAWKAIFNELNDDSLVEIIRQDIQLYLLENTDDENKTCLLHSLAWGNEGLVNVIISMAEELTKVFQKRKPHPLLVRYRRYYSPVEPKNKYVLLGLLKIHCRMERSPFFYLCVEGQSMEHKKPRDEVNETRFRLISRIVEVIEEIRKQIQEENEGSALAFLMGVERPYMEEAFNFTHPRTGYTPLHWLAWHGDSKSIGYIIDKIGEQYNDGSNQELMSIILKMTKMYDLTPIDIAGRQGYFDCVQVILDFFKRPLESRFLHEIYHSKARSKSGTSPSSKVVIDKQAMVFSDAPQDMKIKLKKFVSSSLSKEQQAFARLYYWAAFIEDYSLVNYFLCELGYSPFMDLYARQTPVHASIIAEKYEMLEYFIKDSDMDGGGKEKYFVDRDDLKQYKMTRDKEDENGNNPLHFVFNIGNYETRFKFLQLCLQERVGSPIHRNFSNLLPNQIEHTQPNMSLPDQFSTSFYHSFLERHEADYMIVCTKRNSKIVVEQLRQMNLLKFTKKFNVIKTFQPTYIDRLRNPFAREKDIELVLLSILIPPHQIDIRAEKMKIQCNLTNMTSFIQCKIPFQTQYQPQFTMFDSRERIEAILNILEDEIDFHNFAQSGVIMEHFPLHKRKVSDIQAVFDQNKWNLMMAFVFGGFEVKMGPLNFVKSYLGEKYAFEFAFLLHYQGWLIFPMIFGMILTGYQVYIYVQYGETDVAYDTRLNGFYGFFLSIWASLFLESWKQKQQAISTLWQTESAAAQRDDERSDEFKFNYIYNDQSRVRQKIKTHSPWQLTAFFAVMSYLILIVVVAAMFAYQFFVRETYRMTGEVKERLDKGEVLTMLEEYWPLILGMTNTTVYSIVVIIFGFLYKILAEKAADLKNFQFQSEYDNFLITRLFMFNFLNFYFPSYLMAFMEQRFDEVFLLMLMQMVFKQIGINLMEYFLPNYMTQAKIDDLNKQFSMNEESAPASPFREDLVKEHKRPLNILGSQLNDSTNKETTNFPRLSSVDDLTLERKPTDEVLDDKSPKWEELGGPTLKYEVKKKEKNMRGNLNSKRRHFQALRDFIFFDEKPNILENYMELVVQFGFVVLFGQFFPLAGFFSFISNMIQIKLQINNFQISRRFKPEVANGIGEWMSSIQSLVQVSIVTNCAQIYFTSQTYQNLFIGRGYFGNEERIPEDNDSYGWEVINFFMFLVAIEHLIFILKYIIEFTSVGSDRFSKQTQKERRQIIGRFESQKKQEKFATITDTDGDPIEEPEQGQD